MKVTQNFMQNSITLGQPPPGEKYVAEKRKERKIISNIVDTSFRSNAQGQRIHSARTKTFGSHAILYDCISNLMIDREALDFPLLKTGSKFLNSPI
jgi:hypothetical protein